MSYYRLCLLGSFQLLREGEFAVAFRSEKERALLSYLAIEANRPHSREALAELLWPEAPGDTAHNNLRVTLHRLRQVLGGAGNAHSLLEVSRDAIQITQTGRIWIDVLTFEGLFSQAEQHPHEKIATCQECMTGYAEAAALYRGEFLQGIYPTDSLPFSEWALLNREHLHRQALQGFYLLAFYHQRRGELDLALGYARRQLELESWREEAHSQMMTILALRGERSAALRQYEHCRQVLWEELGVEPSEETRVLYKRILASRKRRRHNFPRQSTPFIGRKAELNRVSEYLANPDCRLLTILGPGGIGKSRLAFQVAETQIYNNLQGVTLVQLAGITTPGDMMRAIAEALGLQFRPGGEPKAQLLDYLREKEMLLVLDNFEQLLMSGNPSAVRIIDNLLEYAPGLCLLVTSRQRLNLRQERAFVLQGLSYPEDIFDQEADKYEAVQLFLQSACRTDPGFQPVEGEQISIVHLSQLLAGVPLAIELAAAWTRVMSPGQIDLEIKSDLDFLASSCPDIPERQRSLRAMFEHSYQLLSPEEQRALSRLSVFPVSFDRLAAEQVAGANLAILTSLSDRSLLEQIGINNRASHLRYRMHELIKQFSNEKLAQDTAEAERTRDRHRSFYMSFLNARNDKVMGGRTPLQAVQEVGGEVENVRLALERAIAQGNLDELGHSYNILMFFYEIQGLFEEAERLFGKIRRRIDEGIQVGQHTGDGSINYLGRAMMYHGWYCMHVGPLNQAIELTKQGLDLCQRSGDLEGYGLGLNSLGVFATNLGKYREAKGYLQDALKVDSENGYIWPQAGALGNLGRVARLEGDLSLAADLFHQELNLDTQLNDEWAIAGSLNGLGDVALQEGNFELAEQRFRQALEIHQKLGQRWRVALSLNRLGDVAYRRREYVEARQDYQESLTILRDFGERYHLASTLASYGEVCTILGENDHARESLHSSIRLAQEIGADGIAARATLGIAALLAKEGERERSVEILASIDEHTSLEYEDKKKVADLLYELQESLPSLVYQTALETGKTKAFEDLVKDILIFDR